VTRTTLPAVAVARPRQPVRHVTDSTMGRPTAAAATLGGDTGGAAADGEAGSALPWGVSARAPAGGGSSRTLAASATLERAAKRRKGRSGRGAATGAVQAGADRRASARWDGSTVRLAAYGVS
jgi:hypothetical protein